MVKSVAFITLGCKVNQFDTEIMQGLFKQAGYQIVTAEEEAQVYVINTCSVTSLSDSKARKLIRKIAKREFKPVIAVTGCYSQVASEELESFEGVRVVMGTADRHKIVEYVEEALEKGIRCNGVTDVMKIKEFEDIPLSEMPSRTRAFLKIQEGCTNFCSYCIIPYTRGPLRSRRPESITREAKKLVAAGFKEIVLTGIHLGAYGKDFASGLELSDGVEALLDIPDLKRIRLGSLESVEVSSRLLQLMKENEKFSRHLHLPLQAGSDEILKAMNRHYRVDDFKKLLQDIRREVPDIAISTDIIVGFPGESEELFAKSLEEIKEMGFSRIHVFPYSKRKGTVAAAMANQVEEAVKKERVHRLQAIGEETMKNYCQGYLGTMQRVLFETDNNGEKDGVTDTYIRVYTRDEIQTGEIYEVKLERLYKDGVYGTIINIVKD